MKYFQRTQDLLAVELAQAHVTRQIRKHGLHEFLAGRVCILAVIIDHQEDLEFYERALTEIKHYCAGPRSQRIITIDEKQAQRQKRLKRPTEEFSWARQTVFLTHNELSLPEYVSATVDYVVPIKTDVSLCEAVARGFQHTKIEFSKIDELHTVSLSRIASFITQNWTEPEIRKKLHQFTCVTKISQESRATDINLDNLVGYGSAATWGKLLASDLLLYRAGQLPWADIDRGILISGPPGVGKTLFARALANTCNLPLYPHSLARWQSQGSLDDLLKAMRSAFEEASKNAPAILFLDEIDSFGNRANLSGHNANYGRQVINGLLEHLDGVINREGVFVIAATNMPELIDPAITRSGRIEHHVSITLPEPAEREGILRFHLGRDLEGEDISDVVESLTGASGADIAKFVRQARRMARLEKRPLALSDLLRLKPATMPLQPHDVHRIAVHEAGHAVVVHALSDSLGMVPVSVMINREVQSGTTRLGGVGMRNTAPTIVKLRENYEAEICSYLGGLAAEHVILGTHSDGGGGAVGSDLSKATEIAIKMVASFGLGENLSFWASHDECRTDWLKYNSQIRTIVDSTLRSCFTKACKIIEERTSAILLIVDQLERNGEADEKAILKTLNHPIDVHGENAGAVTNLKAG
ncbi:AAA family ATPase [Brucella inopinata]|uniref:AAA family ATPase n=1 Tax=Brucella inopinata TaxID=1218315 RepID=A0AAW7B4M9_9HYPH|nr:AAA family ATPase [Brucella inopinata]MDL2334158.1 AAA family ATPase [Brucella inopinata]